MKVTRAENENNLLNRVYYQWRRKRWIFSPRRLKPRPLETFRTAFLLGVQGGGLTLISRCLRRSADAISATGDCGYWTGADEMQGVLGRSLPPAFAGTVHHAPLPDHPRFPIPRSWTYACDELLPYYRKKASLDAPDLEHQKFQYLTRVLATVNRPHYTNRDIFIDKSQVFTVKAGLINDSLSVTDPKFVLVTMNPYVAASKAALGWARDLRSVRNSVGPQAVIQIAAEHWKNSMAAAKEDIEDLLVVKFEDFLKEPEGTLRKICRHIGLVYHRNLLPSATDRLPFGTRFTDRWFPLQSDRGAEHIARFVTEVGTSGLDIITEVCGSELGELGYPVINDDA